MSAMTFADILKDIDLGGLEVKARPGCRISDEKIKIYGAAIEALRRYNGGVLTASFLLEAAKDPRSPLHEHFNWDDEKAANEHRLQQARHLLGSITVSVRFSGRTDSVPIRAFTTISAPKHSTEKLYVPTVAVLKDGDMRKQLVARAFQELARWRERYQLIDELSGANASVEVALATAPDYVKLKKL